METGRGLVYVRDESVVSDELGCAGTLFAGKKIASPSTARHLTKQLMPEVFFVFINC
jgi:hypothetical protein